MNSCIFCDIVNQKFKTEIIIEDKDFIVIKDINPKASTHLLIIPKQHYISLNEYIQSKNSQGYFSILDKVINRLEEKTYKLQINTGKQSGQEVFHFHTHLLSKVALKSG